MLLDYQALLRSVLEKPFDDAPRLVTADWFVENGQEDRGNYIIHSINVDKKDLVVDLDWLTQESKAMGMSVEVSHNVQYNGNPWSPRGGLQYGDASTITIKVGGTLFNPTKWSALVKDGQYFIARWLSATTTGLIDTLESSYISCHNDTAQTFLKNPATISQTSEIIRLHSQARIWAQEEVGNLAGSHNLGYRRGFIENVLFSREFATERRLATYEQSIAKINAGRASIFGMAPITRASFAGIDENHINLDSVEISHIIPYVKDVNRKNFGVWQHEVHCHDRIKYFKAYINWGRDQNQLPPLY